MIYQLCRNGHPTNYDSAKHPENNKNFCPTCGEATLLGCPDCGAPIDDISGSSLSFRAANYCKNCGHSLPWTESALKAARELAQAQRNLSEAERDDLTASIGDLVKDTPTATLAARKTRAILDKAGPAVASMFRDILVDLVSETAKKILFPPF